MNFLEELPKPFFVLAPMDDVTDTVFRQIVDSCAPADLYFTEFVNVDGLQSQGRSKLLKKLRFTKTETKLIAQLWGKEPVNFKKTAEQIADGTFARELGLPEGVSFVGIDLNMGCPAKSEVQNNTCSALIKLENRELTRAIIDSTKEGLNGHLPLSVKTRIGFNEVDLSWIDFLLAQKLDMLTIHGRTRKEMSKAPAHWDVIAEARKMRDKASDKTLIVGNGDVKSRQEGLELAQKHKLDGIMIGRGIFEDPFVFSENSPWPDYSKEQKIELYRKHVELFKETWKDNERKIETLNKFCKVYINGFDGAKEMREKLMTVGSITELLTLLK
jgi:tRNA-dihydrouridine synthase